jgi:hypothetical protein
VGALSQVKGTSQGRDVLLESDHLVGRSSDCRLVIPSSYVSAQHAVIRWTGEQWEARDLASRNGTFVDGVRLRHGEAQAIKAGSVIWFGHPDECWRVVDASPPVTLVVPEDGGAPIVLDGDMIALPSSDELAATLYRDGSGKWRLERADGTIVEVTPGKPFEIAARFFRLSCPAVVSPTSTAGARAEISTIKLVFAASADQEHVEITLDDGLTRRQLPVRNHNYLLLLLARRRLEDSRAGHAPTACGWTFREDLLRDLGVDAVQLNVDIFRIRHQFSSLGIAQATQIIERRPGTKELRIGVASLELQTL